MSKSVYANREGVPSKLVMLGAVSAMEENAKRIATFARGLREHLSKYSPEDLKSINDSRNPIITGYLEDIQSSLVGFESLFNQLAGEPRE